MIKLNSKKTIVALIAGGTILLSSYGDTSWKDVQFAGFISQGYLVNNGQNDYLGETSKGTFDFREYAANVSYSTGAWRFGAQAFGQKLGDYGNDEILLDWASIDYQPQRWLGFRAGRVKLPRGLYNEALDVDSVRPFVLLPQSIYDNRLREFSSSFDGGMVYGNIDLRDAGSLDYKVFHGDMPMTTGSGASDYFNTDTPFPNIDIGLDSTTGGSLFWNTPILGLRTGYSFSTLKNFETVTYIPFRDANGYKLTDAYNRHLFSLEYMVGDWVFAAEAGWEDVDYLVYYLTLPNRIYLFSKDRFGYVSASRRVNDWLELGTYYSYSKFSEEGLNTPLTFPTLEQKDFAMSARFDINERLLFKLEVHLMDGAGKVFDLPDNPQPQESLDQKWTLIALKTTYTF